MQSGKVAMAEGQRAELGGLRVFLFHEDWRQRKYYLSVLRLCGFRQVATADSVSEAIDQIVPGDFDLIFVVYPGETSAVADLLRDMKGVDTLQTIPVVAIMTSKVVGDAMRILNSGACETVSEPLCRESMEKTVGGLLDRSPPTDSAKEKLALAESLDEEGNTERAHAMLLDLLEEEGPRVDVFLGLAQMCCRRQRWLEAETHLRKALLAAKESPGKVEVCRQLAAVFHRYGHFYEMRGFPEKAIKSYRASISFDPFRIESVNALLRVLHERRELEAMASLIKETQSVFPPYDKSLEELALCVRDLARRFVDLNMHARARRMYEWLTTIRHNNVGVHLDAADFLLPTGQASLVLRQLIALSERVKDPNLFDRIGTLLLECERYFLGSGRLDASRSVDLSFFRSLSSSKVISMAEEAFQSASALDGGNPQHILNVARCYLRRRDNEAAVKLLDSLKKGRRADPEVSARVVERLMDERAYDLAAAWLSEMTSRFPDDARFCGLYTEYYCRRDRPRDAVGWLRRGLVLQPDNAAFLVRLAELLLRLGQYTDAVLYFQKAEKLLPDEPAVSEGLRQSLAMAERQGKR